MKNKEKNTHTQSCLNVAFFQVTCTWAGTAYYFENMQIFITWKLHINLPFISLTVGLSMVTGL